MPVRSEGFGLHGCLCMTLTWKIRWTGSFVRDLSRTAVSPAVIIKVCLWLGAVGCTQPGQSLDGLSYLELAVCIYAAACWQRQHAAPPVRAGQNNRDGGRGSENCRLHLVL